MKTAIFEKAGLMTIEEVPKPQLQADDDVIIKVVRACVCGSDLWAYANGDKKQRIRSIQVMKRLVLSKKLALPLLLFNLVILSSCHLLTVVGNVMLAVLVLTERVITTLAIQTGLLVSNQNMFASTMLTGL